MTFSFVFARTVWTWDPLNSQADIVLSNGNLTATSIADDTDITTRSTSYVTTGKWYWEIYFDVQIGTAYQSFGIALPDVDFFVDTRAGWNESWAVLSNRIYHDGSYTLSAESCVDDQETGMFALDADLGRFWTGKEGVWADGGDPANNLNPQFDDPTMIGQNIYVVMTLRRPGDIATARFANNDLLYTPPAGFSAIGG